MTYESPKQIRRRQQAQNDAPRRHGRGPQVVRVPSDEEWERLCEFHVSRIRERAAAGAHLAAGRHAQALAHAALQRRAFQIMRDLHRAYWKAMIVARHELYNCEVAACGHVNTGCGAVCNIRDGYGIDL